MSKFYPDPPVNIEAVSGFLTVMYSSIPVPIYVQTRIIITEISIFIRIPFSDVQPYSCSYLSPDPDHYH